jgi:TonB family protein
MLKKISIGFFITVLLAGATAAQEYRLGLNPPAFEIYKSMLEFAEDEKYGKISQSWEFLGDIPREIKEKFGIDLEKEIINSIRDQNRTMAVTAVRKLIFYDMKDIFTIVSESKNANPAYLKGLVKAAYLDYAHLSPEVAKTDVAIDTKIKNSFRDALAFYSAPTPKPATDDDNGENRRRIEPVLAGIENALMAVFPDFAMTFTSPPVLTRRVTPTYPNLAREAGIEGTVLIKVVVSPDGKVLGALIVNSDVTSTMENEAVRAAKLCEFKPARNGNLNVAATVIIPFDFRL